MHGRLTYYEDHMAGRWARESLGCFGRREFMKATGMALAMASMGTLGCVSSSSPQAGTITPRPTQVNNSMVVATEADPVKLVDLALDTYGGLEGIIHKDDKVVVKANYSFARTEAQGASNQPQVLARIMERCSNAGASEVVAIDHTIDNSVLSLERSGIKAAVEKAGFQALAINDSGDYVATTIPGTSLKSVNLSKKLLDADVFINVPVIKSHSTTLLTASMKHLMGVIYDRQDFHISNIDECISDLAAYLRPDLIIADAYRVIMHGGPSGGAPEDLKAYHQLIVGTDPVAIDAYAASLLEISLDKVDHIRLAAKKGVGEPDLSKVSIMKVGSG